MKTRLPAAGLRQDAATTILSLMPIEVLYEEQSVLVIHKPAGILTQAPPGIDSLEVQIKAWLREREQIKGDVYLAIIHRLDRPASGAIAFCRERAPAKWLSRQFEHRRVAKTYWAFVEGKVVSSEGTWTDHLYKIHGMAQAKVVPADHPGAKQAVLHYRVLSVSGRGTWLEVALETGRTHQVRVQAASRGYPILGDRQYGAERSFGENHDDERARAIALHARSLAFTHPETQDLVEVVAPLPPAWEELDLPVELF